MLAAIRTMPHGTTMGTALAGDVGAAVAGRQANKARAAGGGLDRGELPNAPQSTSSAKPEKVGDSESAFQGAKGGAVS